MVVVRGTLASDLSFDDLSMIEYCTETVLTRDRRPLSPVFLSIWLVQVQITSGHAIKEQLFDMSTVEYLVIFVFVIFYFLFFVFVIWNYKVCMCAPRTMQL